MQSLLGFWWVVAFFSLSAILYEKGIQERNELYHQLKKHLDELNQEKQKAIAIQKELQLQVDSQSDPAWIELVLKRRLGLVSIEERKIYFEEREEL